MAELLLINGEERTVLYTELTAVVWRRTASVTPRSGVS